jgi:hypothetical protein
MLHKQLKALLLVALVSVSGTLIARDGGESFEIYLNNKLLVRQHVTQSFSLQNLNLTAANANDRLVIYYNHCGMPGKSRTIAIKDAAGKVLKTYTFGDAGSTKEGMTIPVKELLALEKNNNGAQLAIHYTAKELPKGLTLSAVKFNDKAAKS